MKVDVVVIGAGPAGSVAAASLIQEGFSVKILESQTFPRFVIGESLLPHSMDYLERTDLLGVVEKYGFQPKTGARFYHNTEYCDFQFKDQHTEGWSYTYQVKRADFDQLLAERAKELGADLCFNAQVTDAVFSKNQQLVKYRDAKGNEQEVTARFVIDASGYGRVLPRLLNLEVPVSSPPRGAVFTHFKDPLRNPEEGQNIFIHAFKDNSAWIWSIPFSDNTASVGIVGDTSFIESCLENKGSLYYDVLRSFPELNKRFQKDQQLFDLRAIRNYSVSVDRLYGDGYVLCGNATEFLDPVFSSGVTLAVASAWTAASLVARQLSGEDLDWEKEYSVHLKKGIDVFRSYVNAWYDGDLQTVFFAPGENTEIKKQICSVLAGYVWDESNPFVKKHKTVLKTLATVIRNNQTRS